MTELCDDTRLQEALAAIQTGRDDDLATADRLTAEYPDDPRVHFLRGSLLAGIGRSIEAMAALKRAVALAPDFAIARFQLGFFQLTSGEVADALATWGPLAALEEDHYLRRFVGGLTHLIRDEFADATRVLEAGIALNRENPPLNRDMQLIIDRLAALRPASPPGEDAQTSATSAFLGLSGSPTSH